MSASALSDRRWTVRLAGLAVRWETHHHDAAALLRRVVEDAAAELPGTDFAGVTLIGPHGPETPAYTDKLAIAADLLQYGTGHGPALDATRLREAVGSPDLARERRWPGFSGPASDLGVAAMLSVPMCAGPRPTGLLTLYAREPRTFPADIATAFASHAVVAFVRTCREAHLIAALSRRAAQVRRV